MVVPYSCQVGGDGVRGIRMCQMCCKAGKVVVAGGEWSNSSKSTETSIYSAGRRIEAVSRWCKAGTCPLLSLLSQSSPAVWKGVISILAALARDLNLVMSFRDRASAMPLSTPCI